MRASGGAQAARGPGQGAERGGAGDAGRPRTLLMLCGCSDAEGTPPLRGPSRLERIGDFHVWPSRFSSRFKPLLSQRPQRPGDTQGRSYHLYPEHAKTRQHASRRSQDKSTRRLSLVSKQGHCPALHAGAAPTAKHVAPRTRTRSHYTLQSLTRSPFSSRVLAAPRPCHSPLPTQRGEARYCRTSISPPPPVGYEGAAGAAPRGGG